MYSLLLPGDDSLRASSGRSYKTGATHGFGLGLMFALFMVLTLGPSLHSPPASAAESLITLPTSGSAVTAQRPTLPHSAHKPIPFQSALGSFRGPMAKTAARDFSFSQQRGPAPVHAFTMPWDKPKEAETKEPPKITEAEVKKAQDAWASAIKTISKTYLDKGDFVGAAATAAGQLYGYGESNVLFKPTKAAEFPFRPKAEEAMSYFVGEKNVKDGYAEDGGFAINGGKGWSDVVFDNHQIELLGSTAIAMGSYYFTCATTGDKTKVEYTFGYKRTPDASGPAGDLRIFLHHSSVPYAAAPPMVTEEQVKKAQAAWASAIKTISKTYLDKGDFVGAAATAAGQLYGYGESNVLFKPTKAAEYPFRPTAEEAMSYFVGEKNVKGGYAEDGGFAINGGKGWSDVVFDNHQIELLGSNAIAMGTYYFTCATTGDKTKVEYTFGYRPNSDGDLRIFLHHSSVPFKMPAPAPEATSEDTGEDVSRQQVIQGAVAGTAVGALIGAGLAKYLPATGTKLFTQSMPDVFSTGLIGMILVIAAVFVALRFRRHLQHRRETILG